MWQAICNGLSWILNTLNSWVGNYGLAIVLFTIFIKIILFPITMKQQKSMFHMQKIQPKMKELQEKYKDNKDKMNKEIANLYRESGVNPLSGCLPMILQMVLLFALYAVLRRPIQYVLHYSPEQITAMVDQLKELGVNVFSSGTTLLEQSKLLALAMDHGVIARDAVNLAFLGIGNIGLFPSDYMAVAPAILAIPLLAGLSAWVSGKTMMLNQPKKPEPTVDKKADKADKNEKVKIDNKTNKKKNEEDMAEAMQRSNKMMMNFMPLMSMGIAYTVPIALGLYWIMQSVIQTIQNLVVKRTMDAYRAEHEEAENVKNNTKPKKKGKKKK